MDHNEFQQRLAEFAEIKKVKPPKNPGIRESQEPEDMFRHGHQFQLTKDLNPTWALEIKKMKPIKRQCQHCDLIVTNQIINKRLLTFPEPHWRETCNACRRVRDPNTGEFSIKDIQAPAFFMSYFNAKNK